MTRSLNLLAPSLNPNTLLDISIPEPEAGPSRQPEIRHLAIKHGEHEAIGHAKRMILEDDNRLLIADDAFRLSRLSLFSSDEPAPPEIVSQYQVKARKGDIWAGLIRVNGGTISAISSGRLDLHPSSGPTIQSLTVPCPLTCLASSSPFSAAFALAGKEVDVSIWDVERTFGCNTDAVQTKKRKPNELLPGQTWCARNMPVTALRLRPPIHHLCLSFLCDSERLLVSGTRAGTVRLYDTRQRRPTAEHKVARDGGVKCVIPSGQHEVFIADHSSFLGAIDLRTGKLLYSYSALGPTPHSLLTIPQSEGESSRIGLASISSDATLRLHSVLPSRGGERKGNNSEGGKAKVETVVGGVGVGGFAFRSWGKMPDVQEEGGGDARGKGGAVADDDDEGDETIWEGMSEVEDEGDEEANEEDEGGEGGKEQEDGMEENSEEDTPDEATSKKKRQ